MQNAAMIFFISLRGSAFFVVRMRNEEVYMMDVEV